MDSHARRPPACGCRPPRPLPARSAGTRLWAAGRGRAVGGTRDETRGAPGVRSAPARAGRSAAHSHAHTHTLQQEGFQGLSAPYSFFSPVAGLRVKHTPAVERGAGARAPSAGWQPAMLSKLQSFPGIPPIHAPVPELSFRFPYTMDCTLTAVPSRPRMRLISLRAGVQCVQEQGQGWVWEQAGGGGRHPPAGRRASRRGAAAGAAHGQRCGGEAAQAVLNKQRTGT